MAKESNRFSALRALREQRHAQELGEPLLEDEEDALQGEGANSALLSEDPLSMSQASTSSDRSKTKDQSKQAEQLGSRGPGRPPGRRSNPDYTQISAYVPLELLLDVQDELARDRKTYKQRTAKPVSALVEELLSDWLKKRKRKKPKG